MPSSDVLFLIGMVAFLVGHLFYMTLFGRVSWQGLRPLQWLIAVVVMGALVTALVKCIGIQGELFVPMLVYGFALMLLIFSALAGVLRMPRGSRATWWILLAGAFLFTFSDACIAMGMFGVMTFALRHFVVMFTYLAAFRGHVHLPGRADAAGGRGIASDTGEIDSHVGLRPPQNDKSYRLSFRAKRRNLILYSSCRCRSLRGRR